MYYHRQDELYHFGVLGMKWGHRKAQETSTGSRRGGVIKQKSKHRTNLEAKYVSRGMSQKQAEKQADKTIRIEKFLAITAGVTVAACTAYAANQYIKNRTDRFLGSGKMSQRVDSNDKLHDVFYASHKKGDNKKYVGLFGRETGIFGVPTGENKNKMALKINSGIKVASRQKSAETFQYLMKTDPSFAQSVRSAADSSVYGNAKQKAAQEALKRTIDSGNTKALTKKAYDGFNYNLIQRGDVADKFYTALKQKGYDAIEDMNDKKMSGFNADALIIFGDKNKITMESISKLTDKEIQKGQNYFVNTQLLKSAFTLGGATSLIAAGDTYINGGTTRKMKKGA